MLIGNEAVVNAAGNLIESQMNKKVEEYKGWCSLDPVKEYFDVTNDYVLKKLLIVLFPFSVRGEDGWKR